MTWCKSDINTRGSGAHHHCLELCFKHILFPFFTFCFKFHTWKPLLLLNKLLSNINFVGIIQPSVICHLFLCIYICKTPHEAFVIPEILSTISIISPSLLQDINIHIKPLIPKPYSLLHFWNIMSEKCSILTFKP